jgi:hypothetical protein
VVNAINRNKNSKSIIKELLNFFTRQVVYLPQNQEKYYKFKVGDNVRISLTKTQRRVLNFKYSLYPGMIKKIQIFQQIKQNIFISFRRY